ncbi:MAG: valine--tRNA ligase [Sphingomonas sp.]
MTELSKTFDPAEIESRWYTHWEAAGLFRPNRPGAQPWTIVNPPPNVTGSLHIGHALDNTLQDILTRYERLRGKDALWVVGTDHAGIATQMVVERQMAEREDKRTNYSREKFVDKVWDWKRTSGGEITRQLRRLGCSMDWANERFTMDEGFSRAVIKVFVELHKQGLLYRDKRLVNWDPGLGTAISDLEVETREISGKFWHLRYPLADGSGHIDVATTRPETMLADMAVAVHPSDERYTALVGKQIKLPITGRLIPIITDEHADPALGSGAVKITPGHDFNDFEVGKRAGFKAAEMLNMLDDKARVVQTADGRVPDELIGLDRFAARARVVAMLKEAGRLIPHIDKQGVPHDAEPRTIQTPYGDRSGVVIEPWLTDQWYVDAAKLARPAIEAVRDGRIKIVPKSWEKTFFNWMENIQPWCVSRQLWWGHRIPVWYGDDGCAFVAESEAEARALAGPGAVLSQDDDVLDTWFSSALWPFATLGWPDADVAAMGRYPNDVLISGFDILFFWDARMMMQGMHFMKDVPFRTLYLHGLVRAADGQKMSKSKGNTVDPLGLIDQYGADALRFFMAAMESQGRDIKMDEARVAGYRNFATKLWNAARFAQGNGIGASASPTPPVATLTVNKWIIGEVAQTVAAVDAALADYRFDGAANAVYQFVWNRFCDWYLELIKPVLGQMDAPATGAQADETRAVAGWVLDQILVLLHPFMPFITEELWSKLGARDYELIVGKWPELSGVDIDFDARDEIEWIIATVSAVRAAKNEIGVAPGQRLTAYVADSAPAIGQYLARGGGLLSRVGRLDIVYPALAPGGVQALRIAVPQATLVIPLDGVIDLDAERARLTKALAAAQKERDALAGRLSNASFVERAKPEAVEKARADHAGKAAEAERLGAALARLA